MTFLKTCVFVLGFFRLFMKKKFCFLQVDIPRVVLNKFAREGLRHLSCYQRIKQSG